MISRRDFLRGLMLTSAGLLVPKPLIFDFGANCNKYTVTCHPSKYMYVIGGTDKRYIKWITHKQLAVINQQLGTKYEFRKAALEAQLRADPEFQYLFRNPYSFMTL